MPKPKAIGGLSRNEITLLAYLREYIHLHGYGPTYTEMRKAIGHKSNGSVARVVDHLERGGHLEREAGRTQALKITPKGLAVPIPAQTNG